MSEGSPKGAKDEPARGTGRAAPAREDGTEEPPRAPSQDDLDDEALRTLAEEDEPIFDEVDVRDLLRSALAPPQGTLAPELLRGVQKKLRARSRGKFYGDGWSTARSPRSTYLTTSVLMLILVLFVFFVLVPWGGGALP